MVILIKMYFYQLLCRSIFWQLSFTFSAHFVEVMHVKLTILEYFYAFLYVKSQGHEKIWTPSNLCGG
jgi:hypothetical protein